MPSLTPAGIRTREALGAPLAARAVAGRARRLDDRAVATAGRARLLQREEPLRGRDDTRCRRTAGSASAPCPARRRCRGRCGRQARASPARSSGCRAASPRRRRAPRPRRPCRAGPRGCSAWPRRGRRRRGRRRCRRGRSRRSRRSSGPGRPLVEPNVSYCLRFSAIREHVVGLLDLLEPRLRLLVARVLVRVVLAGELAVRLLDLILRGVLGNSERFVERAQPRLEPPSSSATGEAAHGHAAADDDAGGPQHAVPSR